MSNRKNLQIYLILLPISILVVIPIWDTSLSHRSFADVCINTPTCENIGTNIDAQNNNCIDVGSYCRNFVTHTNPPAPLPPLPNTQNINCARVTQVCSNGANGGSAQNINCARMTLESCINGANPGAGSTQNVNCADIVGQCSNTGSDSTQNVNCGRTGFCDNSAIKSTQNLNCANSPLFCDNSGIGSTQNLNCQSADCFNQWHNRDAPGNSQTTSCNSANLCSNTGDHTNVLSNGAPCSSGSPHTTTICQPGRTKVFSP